ncbi:PilZ domain-containing protein [Gallaecimonas kandeliae]|uniref:PilZ domain-containing protein n=1 Tax=Gallaecimonas kandeliae TaxID=3029055 RepID=UPI0026472A05|nr:PilZ domain-containing protein [Gallaecimonas kandeliae]WKE67299.1 PilZ domain-containing protein [Gallaecimonas kandeliae]
MIQGDEQRDFKRLAVEAQVVLVSEAAELRGQCLDLSGSGLALVADEPLAAGTQVEVRMDGGMGRLPPFEAKGRVVRCDAQGNRYQLAVAFES